MEAFLKGHAVLKDSETKSTQGEIMPWYSPETGIYHSKYPKIDLPCDHFLDVVSFVFSKNHDGLNALIDASTGSSITHSQLFTLVKSMAAGLHLRGVRQGDVILILLHNSIYFPIVFLGALSVGAVVTPMNPLSSFMEIKKQFLDTKASLVFAGCDRADDLASALGGCRIICVPEEFNSAPSNDSKNIDRLISSNPSLAPSPKIAQEDTAAILYSSGTTGKSKGVMLTHGNFIAMVELFVRFEASLYDYPSTENVYLAAVPMFHVYGLSLFVMGLLSLGSTVVAMKRFHADEMARAIDTYGVTHIPAVPPIVMALTRKAKEFAGLGRLKSLKQVSCGAAPLRESCIKDFVNSFQHVDLIQGYGMTESTAIAARGYNTAKFCKYTSVGLLSPNVQAKVVDPIKGLCMPPCSKGELWLRTPGNMKGYLNDTEATMAAIDEEGWLHTGDVVKFDKDGYLYVIDRLKEVIKYKGFQISPADLDAVLVSHPEVLDAAVTSEKDEEAGDIPVAFVVRKDKSTVAEDAIMKFVANQVAPYKKLRKVYFCSSIPRSPSGKLLRRDLRNIISSVSKL